MLDSESSQDLLAATPARTYWSRSSWWCRLRGRARRRSRICTPTAYGVERGEALAGRARSARLVTSRQPSVAHAANSSAEPAGLALRSCRARRSGHAAARWRGRRESARANGPIPPIRNPLELTCPFEPAKRAQLAQWPSAWPGGLAARPQSASPVLQP